MLALSTYNVVDGIFLGQKLGEDALAAVGIAWPVFPVLLAYELLFSIGAASIASYHLGRGEDEKAPYYTLRAMQLPVLWSILYSFSNLPPF